MKWIDKSASTSTAIRDYLALQTPIGHGLSYKTFASAGAPGGGSWGAKLRAELTADQRGLCAYTGAGIDERLGRLADPNKRVVFASHNEHLKPQSECKAKLTKTGKTYDHDVGDDMSSANVVAALLVQGSGKGAKVEKKDLFGAAHRENDRVPMRPTFKSCEKRLQYLENGPVTATDARDQAAINTISVLNLNNPTLAGWRAQAVAVFIEAINSVSDAETLVRMLDEPSTRPLPEYAFAIRQVVQRMLQASAIPTP